MGQQGDMVVLSDWVAHHVARRVGRYELPAYLVQRATIVIGDCYDVALGPAHTRYFLMQNDGLALPDQGTEPFQSVTGWPTSPSAYNRLVIHEVVSGSASKAIDNAVADLFDGRPIASSAPASSATGCRQKRNF